MDSGPAPRGASRNDGYTVAVGARFLMSTMALAASPSELRALAEQSNAWPFEQAKEIVARLKKHPKDEVLFETGYGPSGLPHIGTSARSRAPPWCAMRSAC